MASIILSILPDSFIGLSLSRTIFGLGFGSIYISSIIYASEITSAEFRAKAIFTLQSFVTLGMFIFSVLCLTRNFDLVLRVTGIVSAIFSIVSLALGYFTMKTSHIFMMRNNSRDAKQRFQYFHRDRADSIEYETTVSYMIEESKRKFNFLSKHNVSALIVVSLVKIGYLSLFNALHNSYRSLFLSTLLSFDDTNYSEFTMMGTRLVGCFSGFFILDHLSKRSQYLISTVTISTLLFAFGALFIIDKLQWIWMPLIFFIPIEFFIGFGMSQLDDILKGEIFPFKEKSLSIATAIVLEQCIHIIFIILLYSWVFSLGSVPRILTVVFGAITLVCGFALFFLLRDSRRQNLVQVSNLYSNN